MRLQDKTAIVTGGGSGFDSGLRFSGGGFGRRLVQPRNHPVPALLLGEVEKLVRRGKHGVPIVGAP